MKKIFLLSLLLNMTLCNVTNLTNNNYNTNNINLSFFFSQEIINKIEAMRDSVYRRAETPLQAMQSMYTWMMDNKFKTALYLAGASYIYLHYRLWYTKYILQDPENWSLWNKAIPLEELFATPQKQLAETLTHEIQRRYTNLNAPDDFVGPMVAFFQAVEKETVLLKSYERLCGWSKTLYISKIVWFDEELYTACDARLKKLAYIKSIFINWVAEYKINLNAAPAVARL